MALVVTPGQLNQRADFYFQLHSLIKAGVPVIQGLEMLVGNNWPRSYVPHLRSVILRLQTGATLFEALKGRPGFLPEFDLSLIEAGELSGRLDAVFHDLGEHYKDRATLAGRMLGALAYPFLILHVFILVMPPHLLPLLIWQGEVAMFITQKLSVFIPLYGVIALGVFFSQSNRGRGTRLLMERLADMVPLLGKARRAFALARFSGALEALTGAGVPIIKAWDLAASASGSSRIQKAVARAVPLMNAGATPAEAIRNLDAFPDVFRNLYSTGEVTGQLDDSLARLRDYYQEQSTTRFRAFALWMPLVIYLLILIAGGFMVIRFYADYYGNILNQ